MWTCQICERKFAKNNQSHFCVTTTIDDLFKDKPDNLLVAFDRILVDVFEFGEMSIGASKNTVIFTNKKAFLIIRPMSKLLDLKFYFNETLKSAKLHTTGAHGKYFYHHIRIQDEEDVDHEVISLLKKGYNYGLM